MRVPRRVPTVLDLQARGLEILGQLDRHLDLLEEAQRERQLAALVHFDVRERQLDERAPRVPSTAKLTVPLATLSRAAACTSVIITRNLRPSSGRILSSCTRKRAGAELARDQAAIELQLLLLARSLGLQFADHALRLGLRLPIDALADLGGRDAVLQRLVLLAERADLAAQLQAFQHRVDDRETGARAAQFESAVEHGHRNQYGERRAAPARCCHARGRSLSRKPG